jgi:hypothetical protein
VVLAFVAVASARIAGSGGSDIASAPNLPYGQTINSGVVFDPNSDTVALEYWKLPLATADKLTIDWGSTNGLDTRLCLFAPSVTDYTRDNTDCLVSDETSGKSEMTFVAPTAGSYILNVLGYCCGDAPSLAYVITAIDKHALTATLSPASRSLIASSHRGSLPLKGSFTIHVESPAGVIPRAGVGATVSGYWNELWHKVGAASAGGNSLIKVPYKFPKSVGGPIKLEINIGGGNYEGRSMSFGNVHLG